MTHDPRQLELFADGVRAVSVANQPKPPPLTEKRLQAKLDPAPQLLREMVILGMKTWLPEETLKGLNLAEAIRREQVRMHFRILEHAAGEQWRTVRSAAAPAGVRNDAF